MRKGLLFVAAVVGATAILECDRSADEAPTGEPTRTTPAGTRAVSPGAPVMQPAQPTRTPQEQRAGALETVATFDEAMPTGVAVSRDGRVFVSFPRGSDPLSTSVAELRDGVPAPYPDRRWNPPQPGDAARTFVGVASVVVDAKNRLWVLDTGTVDTGPVEPRGAKLVGFDLTTNTPFEAIHFGTDVALPSSYLNDVRFDLSRGPAGYAYISDSSSRGPNAIVVVDLDSKKAWRRLVDHPSVRPARGFLAIVEGRPLYLHDAGGPRAPFVAGVDGIEVSPDGKTVYYSPLASRSLYGVSADALSDPTIPDGRVAATVKDLGEKGASDGMVASSDGSLFVTDYENDAVLRRDRDGILETVATDPRLVWPDSMAIGPDGWLYVVASQLGRQAALQGGKDRREKPYALFRVKTGAVPVGFPR
jgi:sugar lactone lactonase YvrE